MSLLALLTWDFQNPVTIATVHGPSYRISPRHRAAFRSIFWITLVYGRCTNSIMQNLENNSRSMTHSPTQMIRKFLML